MNITSRSALFHFVRKRRLAPIIKCSYSGPVQSWGFPRPIPPPSDDYVSKHGLPLLQRVVSHAERPFLSEHLMNDTAELPTRRSILSYEEILWKAHEVSLFLQERKRSASLFTVHATPPGSVYVACQWGSFAAGQASVPLSISQKTPEIEHVLTDANPGTILVSRNVPNYDQVVQAATNLNMSDRLVFLEDDLLVEDKSGGDLQAAGFEAEHFLEGAAKASLDHPALLLYTSGTTGKPKGVLHTHRSLYHQVTDLVAAWEWQPEDVALHVLPLHHVHGVVNVLTCASFVGAQLQFQPFEAKGLWHQWAQDRKPKRPRQSGSPACNEPLEKSARPLPRISVLMAVPTIYAKLLEAAKTLPDDIIDQAVRRTLYPMRLQISGSAALPTSILHEWQKLTGHTLLERYGMTEFAMALSNPYNEVAAPRKPGHVGLPLPSVQVRLVDETDRSIIETPYTSGALQVKGPTVFQEYLNRPDATKEAFTEDGFFDTGDVAEYNEDAESYRILGRASVDILKVGGYKLSALEIERALLEHPNIQEVVIVGIPDETWGQRVGMIGRTTSETKESPSLESIQSWCEPLMAKYKTPTKLLWLEEIPKNAMGKVSKKELVHLFQDASFD